MITDSREPQRPACHSGLPKLKNGDRALSLFRQLKGLVKVTSVSESKVKNALKENFEDFEDVLQYFSAKAETDVNVVLTRNQFDFPKNLMRVESPEEFLARREDASS